MSGYLIALCLTVGVETPLYAGALRALGDRRRKRWAVAAAVNLSSHPLAWLVVYRALGTGAVAFVAAEAFVVAWEAAWLRRWLGREAALLVAAALVANGVSLALGALL